MSDMPNNAGNAIEDDHPEYSIDTFLTGCSCTAPTSRSGQNTASGSASDRQTDSDQEDTTGRGDKTLSGMTEPSKGKGKRPDPNGLARLLGKHMVDSNMERQDPPQWPEWETSGNGQMSVFLRQQLDKSSPNGIKAIKFKPVNEEGAGQMEQAASSAILECLSTLPEVSQILQVHIFRVNASQSVVTFIDASNDWCYVLVDWDELDGWMGEWHESRPMERVSQPWNDESL